MCTGSRVPVDLSATPTASRQLRTLGGVADLTVPLRTSWFGVASECRGVGMDKDRSVAKEAVMVNSSGGEQTASGGEQPASGGERLALDSGASDSRWVGQ